MTILRVQNRINSAIAASFTIDYLDQEHLYKIVDTHIFPKGNQMQPVLHEIYGRLRGASGFRWSEQRFSSLYPLHPIVLEITPLMQLYVHDFALLGFASDSGAKILGRPSNSLIAPDEVFDNVEHQRDRTSQENVAAYDSLNSSVVASIPVMQRLPAKMILKGRCCFFRSTATGQPRPNWLLPSSYSTKTILRGRSNHVREILDSFAVALPDEIQRHSADQKAA